MKAREVKKLLGCSYSSLDNYVKQKKLICDESDSQKRNYNDESVYKLYDEICGRKKMHNKVSIFIKNQKYEFELPPKIISNVLDYINESIKSELNINEVVINIKDE